MGLKEDWEQLTGQQKMMVVGGGGLAVFFLITAIRNKSASNQVQTTPKTPAQMMDPAGSLDAMTAQMQDLQNQLQVMQNNQTPPTPQPNYLDMINQYKNDMTNVLNKNQEQTNSEIQNLINRMGKSSTQSAPQPTPPRPQPTVQPKPQPRPSNPIVYTAFGKTYLNSSLWGLSKMYVMNHEGANNPTNAQIQTELNRVINLNHVKNPNLILKGQKFRMN